ncbi:MAG: hypothetical protein Fur0028_00230 [Bacteroidales bacterium]
MIKYLFYIFNFIGFLILSLFQDPVSVSIQAPEEATVGTSIIVQVTINKGNVSSFARYQQNLPVGYTAEAVNLPNGDFTFKDQRIIVGWLSLPRDSQITFTYKINIDPTAEGPLFLSGIFSYIENNERRNIETPTVSVIIRPVGYVAQNNQQSSNIDTTQHTETEFKLENVFCYRQIERTDNEIVVSLLVNTANLPRDKFAKIQEIVPSGYTATALETNEGIFSFKDNNVKFLWMSLPPQKQFIVSYKLTSVNGMSEIPALSGSLSYIENEATKIKSIQNKDFLNSSLMASVNEQKQQKNQNQINISNNNQTTQLNNQQNQTNNNQKDNNQNLANNINQQNKNNKQNKNTTTNYNNQNVANNTIPIPETGIKFRVQIAAGHKLVNARYYFKNFNINETVQVEQHEGWHKYTIGSFGAYKDARDKRVQVWQNTPIHDAFVSAYNNGTRITVQEALMIANQKWVQ